MAVLAVLGMALAEGARRAGEKGYRDGAQEGYLRPHGPAAKIAASFCSCQASQCFDPGRMESESAAEYVGIDTVLCNSVTLPR